LANVIGNYSEIFEKSWVFFMGYDNGYNLNILGGTAFLDI
jgi:hypothetical protein